jgi:hypothetical protein
MIHAFSSELYAASWTWVFPPRNGGNDKLVSDVAARRDVAQRTRHASSDVTSSYSRRQSERRGFVGCLSADPLMANAPIDCLPVNGEKVSGRPSGAMCMFAVLVAVLVLRFRLQTVIVRAIYIMHIDSYITGPGSGVSRGKCCDRHCTRTSRLYMSGG